MLLAAGHRVTMFDNFMFGAQPIMGLAMNPDLRLIKGDVRDAATIARVVPEYDWVFHLAAIVGYPACAADPSRATTTNVDGTRNVVKALGRGQRLVFASTGSTYGKVEGVATEQTPIAPLTLYGQNKRDAEQLIGDSPAGRIGRALWRGGG